MHQNYVVSCVNDHQLGDILRFCTNLSSPGVLGADPTFNLEKFDVTVTTYNNLLVVNPKTRRHHWSAIHAPIEDV